MLTSTEKYIQHHHLTDNLQQPIVVAVSGGRDSVVLLDIMVKLGYQCIVAHCNFQLRGNDSLRDQQFSKQLAEQKNLLFLTIDFNTSQHAQQHGISIEMAARELRYKWLETLRKSHNAQAIAVGHHADDNAETVILNLIRGSGIKGLTGMQARNGYLIRPLLSATRTEIDLYVREHQLTFVEDHTNASTDFVRNKIRHVIIPMMESINPSVLQSINDTAGYLSGAHQIYSDAVERLKATLLHKENDRIYINIEKLSENSGITPTLLFELLHPFGYNSKQMHQIADGVKSQTGKVFYSPTHRLLKNRSHFILTPIYTLENKGERQNGSQNKMPPEHEIRIFRKDDQFTWSTNPNCIHLDADIIQMPLHWRLWQPGDYFYPLGMKGKKKISDYLIDQKINRIDKFTVWVAEAADGSIVWLAGHRIDERFKTTASTENILEIKLLSKQTD